MNEKDFSLVVWHGSQISQAERQKLLNQQPITRWLTGISLPLKVRKRSAAGLGCPTFHTHYGPFDSQMQN